MHFYSHRELYAFLRAYQSALQLVSDAGRYLGLLHARTARTQVNSALQLCYSRHSMIPMRVIPSDRVQCLLVSLLSCSLMLQGDVFLGGSAGGCLQSEHQACNLISRLAV